jgi:hypothetical protein
MIKLGGREFAPYTKQELVRIKERVGAAIEYSIRSGIGSNDAHPMLPRLLATLETPAGWFLPDSKEKEILLLLHSITDLSIHDGPLDVWYNHQPEPFTATEYKAGSFTRELLELIEKHLTR